MTFSIWPLPFTHKSIEMNKIKHSTCNSILIVVDKDINLKIWVNAIPCETITQVFKKIQRNWTNPRIDIHLFVLILKHS